MADRSVAATDVLDTLRTTFNSTAADVGDIASVTGASGVIASATDLVEAITLMNTEVTAIKNGTAVFETKITFEGDTADAHETVLAITDPTADRTITLPNASGAIPVLAAASNTQITATPEELNHVDGVTGNIQTALDSKATEAFAIAQAVALG